MKVDVAEVWVDALRSGDYNHHVGSLKSTRNSWCALGVLCDVAVKNSVGGLKWKSSKTGYSLDGLSFWPPDSVIEWAGIRFNDDDNDGSIPMIDKIVEMNDVGRSFDDIADQILVSVELL